jgi:betaine lipid synthase
MLRLYVGFDPVPASQPLPERKTSESANETPEAALESLRSELDYEILEMKRVLALGGHVVWRSAGKCPWYIQRFELAGFKVEAVDIREGGKAIDRVNFYASLYRAKKIAQTTKKSGNAIWSNL